MFYVVSWSELYSLQQKKKKKERKKLLKSESPVSQNKTLFGNKVIADVIN
jgi:hypothetical protein